MHGSVGWVRGRVWESKVGAVRYILNLSHSPIQSNAVCKITNSLIKLFLLLLSWF